MEIYKLYPVGSFEGKEIVPSYILMHARMIPNHGGSDDPGKKTPPNKPDKNIPAKPDRNPDPTRPRPGGNEPEKNDPTRIDDPPPTDPTRIDDPEPPKPQNN